MPAAVALAAEHVDLVDSYEAAMRAAGRRTGRSTMQAARTLCAKLERAGGWDRMTRARRLDAIRKARSFASWLMVTGQLTVDADVFGRVYLRLGTAARDLLSRRTQLVRRGMPADRDPRRRHRDTVEQSGHDHRGHRCATRPDR